MNPVILSNIPCELDIDKIAKQLHVERDSDDYADLVSILEQVNTIAKPKALYKPTAIAQRGGDSVTLDGHQMCSSEMAERIADVERVFVFVSTCGDEIEQWSKTVTDMLHNWWMERIKEHVLAAASAYLKQHIAADMGFSRIASINPGALPDWPLSEQQRLFALLGDTQNMIGVSLTDSMLMSPAKSLSGFLYEAVGD